jgi:hypothetical protein
VALRRDTHHKTMITLRAILGLDVVYEWIGWQMAR